MGGSAFNTTIPVKPEIWDDVNLKITHLLSAYDWDYIGSVGQGREVGDVDVIIKTSLGVLSNLFTNIGYRYKTFKGFNQISVEFPINDTFIQLDLMCTENMNWSRWVYKNSPSSHMKGRYRTTLIMATVVGRTQTEDKTEQYSVLLDKGVFKVKKQGNKVLSREFVTDDPIKVCELIGLEYEKTINGEDILKQVESDNRVMLKFNEYNNL